MDLAPGEKILFQGHPSWRSILGYYLKGLLVAAVFGALAALVSRIAEDEVNTTWVVVAVLAVVILLLLIGLLRRIATTYTITNRRLQIKRGIVARRVQETRLDRVQNVNTEQSALQRVLQVGTVDFDTAGTDDSDFTFAGVAQPEQVVRDVDEAQREALAANAAAEQQPQAQVPGQPQASPPPPAAPPPPPQAPPPPPPSSDGV
ncbi:MAG: PH domain-containing protein [Solirubrobacteraceae bacterium]